MKIEEFEPTKFIFPFNDWRCFVCRRQKESLEFFAETDEKEVCLVCDACFHKNLQMLRAGLADF